MANNKVLRVLLVEDNPHDAELILLKIRKANGFALISKRVETEAEFRQALHQDTWDIILSDMALPTFDGLQAFEIFKDFGLDNVPFILLSGVATQEEITLARKKGIREYLPKGSLDALYPIVQYQLHLANIHDETIQFFVGLLSSRDGDTAGHSERVTELTVDLALNLGVSKTEIIHIRRGALLHDIGKIGVSDTILLKPGKLTEGEYEKMRLHPEIGYNHLQNVKFLGRSLDIPHYHHERWDGTGYPRGLKGEEIPLAARIFSIVDVYDALTSDRPYRAAWTKAETLEFIKAERGTMFDPRVTDVFVKMMEGRDDS